MKTTATATPVDLEPDVSSPPESSPAEAPDRNSAETESTESSATSQTEEVSSHPWDTPINTPQAAPDEQPDQKKASLKSQLKFSILPLAVAGVGLSLLVFCTTLFALTRPCAIGQCRVIPEAQKLSQNAIKTLQKPDSGKAVLDAQNQLQEAMALLEAIPPWSSHHRQAQDLLKTYRAQSETVKQMVEALKTAARAGYRSENPPHSASEWMAIQQLWRDAIAQLEQLPTDKKLQPLTQQRIKAYKTNLAEINQRLFKERQAQQDIRTAKQAAQMAEVRQGIAQSLSDWQLVYATWQTAMKRLKQIPQGTTAYQEAQQLSALYLPKMANARNRKTKEQIAANAYNQGVRLAQLATDAQVDNQWSAALVHWRNALTYVNQVPKDTFYYGKAQGLVRPYRSALKQAQGQLQLTIKIQQTKSDLHQTCSGKTQVCTYTLNNKLIKVRLAPGYVQTMRQRAFTAQSKGDSNAHAGVVNHILTLEEALQAISDNAKIRLEIYSPDGFLIEAHNPGN